MFLFPISRYESESTPVVTVCLILISSVLWLLLWMASYPQEVFTTFGFVPLHPHAATLVSSLFISEGLLYVLPNMIFLSVLGKQLEDAFGHMLFFALYMVCGVGSTLVFYLVNRSVTTPCSGATGALAGVIAAFWIMFPEEVFDVQLHLGWWHVTDFEARTFAVGAAWLGWELVVGLVEDRMPRGFIVWANIGGFAIGLIVALLLKPILRQKRKERRPEPESEIGMTTLQL